MAALAPALSSPGVTQADACFHCATPLPRGAVHAVLGGRAQAFCCAGCATAAQWIVDARLDDYYRLRSQAGGRPSVDGFDAALWDREDLLPEHTVAVDDAREIVLLVEGMRCAACAWLIDRALASTPGVREVGANAITGRVRLRWDPAITPLSAPLSRLAALGYRPYLSAGAQLERARAAQRNRDLLRVGVAGLGAMQAMMFAEALYLDTAGTMSLPMRDFLRWVTFLVSTPVVFFAGASFLTGAWRELREWRPGMDLLVAASTLLAYAASVVETVRGGPHVWYDAAAMFVFLLLVARLLEQRVRRVASAQVDALARARPVVATREDADGRRESVPVGTLAVGDVVAVAIGEAVPADGELLAAPATFEEALLTGEPRPVLRVPGDRVYAGSICGDHPVRLRVTAVGSGTWLSQLAALVDRAQAHRPRLARVADRVAGGFVLALLVATVAVYAAWRVHAPERAFEVALALLVVSCPCALSLAVPAALASANGALARMGVLPVRADALERLAGVDDVIFDKTGTLSDGTPILSGVDGLGLEHAHALRVAAALERDSTHPVARAFLAAADGTPPQARRVVAHPGRGIEGIVDGRHWRLGRADFACGGADDGAIWLGDGSTGFARFTLGECPRPDAAPALSRLRQLGLHLHLSSGDAAPAVESLAQALGLDAWHARQLPQDKLDYVRGLQAQGRAIAMVGDGLNDAPVLAGADVSIAMSSGAALAHQAADLVLATPRLDRIADAIDLARRTRRIVKQNFAWALGYNLVALPLAAMGLVTPWIAALCMALSSLTVTLNALRLSRRGRP